MTPEPSVPRNTAIDCYRGLVMFLMMAEVLRLSVVAHAFPGNWLLSVLAYNQTHVEWEGGSLHDMIQPSFSFLVGVALPYSIASRMRSGRSFQGMFSRALWRSLLLVALGIFLRSVHSSQTNYTFEDTLTQIGLGYPFLFLLGFRSPRWQWIAFGAILFVYWLAWALYPVPQSSSSLSSVGVPADWSHTLTGFASHWNKNTNLGQAFDLWFLNLFPRSRPFLFNGGGYLTLSFIPTLATMILGLIAGRWCRILTVPELLARLVQASACATALGLVLHFTGICPIVKRIWTPAWTLFSGGICFLFLAAFTWTIVSRGHRAWAFPLVVIGTNSIAAYLIAHLCQEFVTSSLQIHLGHGVFQILGPGLEPLLFGVTVLAIMWLMLYWMYRQRIFLRL